jgi:cytochrome c oxidase assembly protein subunit 15
MLLLVPKDQHVVNSSVKKFTLWLLMLLLVQLVFGAFMAGLKAAQFAATWPLINGEFLPSSLAKDTLSSFTHDPLAVHFVHRNLGYLLALFILFWYYKARQLDAGRYFNALRRLPLLLVLVQVLLGILTVLYANNSTGLLWLGVAHQFTGMMLLLSFVGVTYLLKRK